MLKEVEKVAGRLHDAEAAWSSRREAADTLAKAAKAALAALNAHREDEDIDVRMAAQEALRRIGETPAGSPGDAPGTGEPEKQPYAIEALVRYCEKAGQRRVKRDREGFSVEVTLEEGRHQTVYIRPYEKSDGRHCVRLFTFCGEPTGRANAWVLESNVKLVNCAFGIYRREAERQLVVVKNYERSDVTPGRFKAALKAIAMYGDWFEKRLTGKDVY